MTHYHITAAYDVDEAISCAIYENYEDSIEAWVKLSTEFFEQFSQQLGGLEIEKAKAATGNGDGFMARVGTNTICFYWMRCDAPNCYSITWN